jgi:hypothetical protein
MKALLVFLARLIALSVILLASQIGCSHAPADGTVIRRSTREIYLIENGRRRRVPDLRSLLAYGLGKRILDNPDRQVDKIPLGPEMPSVPSAFIQRSTGEIYYLDAGKRRQFVTTQTLFANFPNAVVKIIPDGAVDSIQLGLPIPDGVKIVEKERDYDLKIVSVSPTEALLEHQPIRIQYELHVREVGVLGDLTPATLRGAVCPVSNKGTCSMIADLQPDHTFNGVIEAFAPPAGRAAPVAIKLVTEAQCTNVPDCFAETILSLSDDFGLPVAARYDIAIVSFDLHRPRAKVNDTVKISLRSGLQGHGPGGNFCSIFGGNFCAVLIPQGDFGTGVGPFGDGPHTEPHVIVNNVRVGSFDLIPEVSDNLAFEYDVENLGVSYDQRATQLVLDSMSQATAGILDAVMQSGNFDKLDSFANKIHGLDQCDGPVAVDAKLILNKSDPNLPGLPTLDSLTRDNGRFIAPPTRFEGTDSGLGCGVNSLYDVTWAVIRTSWQSF